MDSQAHYWQMVEAIGTVGAVIVALATPYWLDYRRRKAQEPIVGVVIYYELMHTIGRLKSAAEFLRDKERAPRQRLTLGARRVRQAKLRFTSRFLSKLDVLDRGARDHCAALVGSLAGLDVDTNKLWTDDLLTIEYADLSGKMVEDRIVVAVDAFNALARSLDMPKLD